MATREEKLARLRARANAIKEKQDKLKKAIASTERRKRTHRIATIGAAVEKCLGKGAKFDLKKINDFVGLLMRDDVHSVLRTFAEAESKTDNKEKSYEMSETDKKMIEDMGIDIDSK